MRTGTILNKNPICSWIDFLYSRKQLFFQVISIIVRVYFNSFLVDDLRFLRFQVSLHFLVGQNHFAFPLSHAWCTCFYQSLYRGFVPFLFRIFFPYTVECMPLLIKIFDNRFIFIRKNHDFNNARLWVRSIGITFLTFLPKKVNNQKMKPFILVNNRITFLTYYYFG